MKARPGQVFADLPTRHARPSATSHYRTSEEYRATTDKVSRALQEAIHDGRRRR